MHSTHPPEPPEKGNQQDEWRKLCNIYAETKVLILRTEEIDPEHELQLAPLVQHRDTLDHIVRAKLVELGEVDRDRPEEYIASNLDKAKGHAYRAFFDAADWLSVVLRRQIKRVEKYPLDVLDAVFPEYYRQIYVALANVDNRIAAVRKSKDIGNDALAGKVDLPCNQTPGMLEVMVEYRRILEELDDYYEQVYSRIVPLEKRRSQKKKSNLFKSVLWIASVIISALIGTALTLLLT